MPPNTVKMNQEQWNEFEERFSCGTETPHLGEVETARFEESPVIKQLPSRQANINESVVDAKGQSASIVKQEQITYSPRSKNEDDGQSRVSKVLRLAQQIENRVAVQVGTTPPMPRKFSSAAAEKFRVVLRSVSTGTIVSHGGVDHEGKNKDDATIHFKNGDSEQQSINAKIPSSPLTEAPSTGSSENAKRISQKSTLVEKHAFSRANTVNNLAQQIDTLVCPSNKSISVPDGVSQGSENLERLARNDSAATHSPPNHESVSNKEHAISYAIVSHQASNTYQGSDDNHNDGPTHSDLFLSEIDNNQGGNSVHRETIFNVRNGAISRASHHIPDDQVSGVTDESSEVSQVKIPSVLETINRLRRETLAELEAENDAVFATFSRQFSYTSAVSHTSSAEKFPVLRMPGSLRENLDDEYYDEEVDSDEESGPSTLTSYHLSPYNQRVAKVAHGYVGENSVTGSQLSSGLHGGAVLQYGNQYSAEAPAGIPQVTRARERTLIDEDEDYFYPAAKCSLGSRGATASQYASVEDCSEENLENDLPPRAQVPQCETSLERSKNRADIPAILRIGSAGQYSQQRRPSAAQIVRAAQVARMPSHQRLSREASGSMTDRRASFNSNWSFPEVDGVGPCSSVLSERRQPALKVVSAATPKYPQSLDDLLKSPEELGHSPSTASLTAYNTTSVVPRTRKSSFGSLASSIQSSNPYKGSNIAIDHSLTRPLLLARDSSFVADVLPDTVPDSPSSSYSENNQDEDRNSSMTSSTMNTITPSESASNYREPSRDPAAQRAQRAQLREYHATHLEINGMPLSLIPRSPNPNTSPPSSPPGRKSTNPTSPKAEAPPIPAPVTAPLVPPPTLTAASALYELKETHTTVRLTPEEVKRLPFGTLAGPIKAPPGLNSEEINHAVGTPGFNKIDAKTKQQHRNLAKYMLTECPENFVVPENYAQELAGMKEKGRQEMEAEAAEREAEAKAEARAEAKAKAEAKNAEARDEAETKPKKSFSAAFFYS